MFTVNGFRARGKTEIAPNDGTFDSISNSKFSRLTKSPDQVPAELFEAGNL